MKIPVIVAMPSQAPLLESAMNAQAGTPSGILAETRIPERVTCIRCLKTLRNVGLVAEGLLRAAGEAA